MSHRPQSLSSHMADEADGYMSADGGCAPPPVFEGDPENVDTPRAFPWSDLLDGTGDFCVDKDASSYARWKQMSSTSKAAVSVTTFSRSVEDKGGVCEFLIRGSLPIARDTYFCVNADMEYRPEWDDSCVSLAELSSSGPGADAGAFVERDRVLHWNVNYPWPLGKRDYILEQTILSGVHRDGRIYRCTQGRTLDAEVGKRLRPMEKGVTRIQDYRAHLAIWSGSTQEEANFALLYFEDGKLNVPNWVMTKAAATTIPAQVSGYVPVAAKYPKKRLQQMTKRYFGGGDVEKPKRKASLDDIESQGGDADEETFFSASEPDSPVATPMRSGKQSTRPVPRSPALASATKIGADKTPVPSKKRVVPKGQAKDGKMASKLESVLRLVLPRNGDAKVKDDSDDGDLEEGVLIVGKEERDLLLNLLAEARQKQAGGWWFCPCRHRCGSKRRHRQ